MTGLNELKESAAEMSETLLTATVARVLHQLKTLLQSGNKKAAVEENSD